MLAHSCSHASESHAGTQDKALLSAPATQGRCRPRQPWELPEVSIPPCCGQSGRGSNEPGVGKHRGMLGRQALGDKPVARVASDVTVSLSVPDPPAGGSSSLLLFKAEGGLERSGHVTAMSHRQRPGLGRPGSAPVPQTLRFLLPGCSRLRLVSVSKYEFKRRLRDRRCFLGPAGRTEAVGTPTQS